MTTPADPDDIVAFLRARYDERERWARAADEEWSRALSYVDGDVLAHVDSHDPAYVLADLAAKGEILDWCESVWDDGTSGAQLAQFTLRQFARPFAGHPDYRSEWAVAK